MPCSPSALHNGTLHQCDFGWVNWCVIIPTRPSVVLEYLGNCEVFEGDRRCPLVDVNSRTELSNGKGGFRSETHCCSFWRNETARESHDWLSTAARGPRVPSRRIRLRCSRGGWLRCSLCPGNLNFPLKTKKGEFENLLKK